MRRSLTVWSGSGGGSGGPTPGLVQRARDAVSRPFQAAKRYIDESLDTLRPMDNPPGYDDEHQPKTKDGSPKRTGWRTPGQHAAVWRRAFRHWRGSFDYDEFRRQGHPGLGRGLKRGGSADEEEEEEEQGLVDRLKGLSPETRAFFERKDEAARRVKELQAKLQTDLTPEEMESARKELLQELKSGQASAKAFAEDRVELMKLTVKEFVDGYKEGRDQSGEEIRATIQKQVESVKSMLLEGEWTPEAIEANKQRNLATLKEAFDKALSLSAEEKRAVEEEVRAIMRGFDESVDSEEVMAAQRKVEAVIRRVGSGVKGAVTGAVKGAKEGEGKGGGLSNLP